MTSPERGLQALAEKLTSHVDEGSVLRVPPVHDSLHLNLSLILFLKRLTHSTHTYFVFLHALF